MDQVGRAEEQTGALLRSWHGSHHSAWRRMFGREFCVLTLTVHRASLTQAVGISFQKSYVHICGCKVQDVHQHQSKKYVFVGMKSIGKRKRWGDLNTLKCRKGQGNPEFKGNESNVLWSIFGKKNSERIHRCKSDYWSRASWHSTANIPQTQEAHSCPFCEWRQPTESCGTQHSHAWL